MENNTYENAPASSLLATNCLCCNRPLVDAASVEAGIGPICREKYGYNSQIDEATRVEANVLIHEAARADTEVPRVLEIADLLEAMGAQVLASKVRTRFIKPPKYEGKTVTIERHPFIFADWSRTHVWGDEVALHVYTPGRNKQFNEDLKATVSKYDRGVETSNGKFECWVVASKCRVELWTLLRRHFAGATLVTPEGKSVTIPTEDTRH